jgi:hypothetical protein
MSVDSDFAPSIIIVIRAAKTATEKTLLTTS